MSVTPPKKLKDFLSNATGSGFDCAWPEGLKETLYDRLGKINYRFFILDDSSSMKVEDGKVLKNNKMEKCSRWNELVDCALYHAELSKHAYTSSSFGSGGIAGCSYFTLLNSNVTDYDNQGDPHVVRIGDGIMSTSDPIKKLKTMLDKVKNGFDSSHAKETPLCKKMEEVIEAINTLKQDKGVTSDISITIITDGKSSDGELHVKLRGLLSIKSASNNYVSIVVRLCTQDKEIINYWNGLDILKNSDLKALHIDILENLGDEQLQVTEKNPWLTYGLPIHRFREFGVDIDDFDGLDEVSYLESGSLDAVREPAKIKSLVHSILGKSIKLPTITKKGDKLELFVKTILEHTFSSNNSSPHTQSCNICDIHCSTSVYSPMDGREMPYIRTDILAQSFPAINLIPIVYVADPFRYTFMFWNLKLHYLLNHGLGTVRIMGRPIKILSRPYAFYWYFIYLLAIVLLLFLVMKVGCTMLFVYIGLAYTVTNPSKSANKTMKDELKNLFVRVLLDPFRKNLLSFLTWYSFHAFSTAIVGIGGFYFASFLCAIRLLYLSIYSRPNQI